MKYFTKILSIAVFVCPLALATIPTLAQPGPGNPQGDPDMVPITGLEYLLVSGGLLGGYKLLKGRTSRQEQ